MLDDTVLDFLFINEILNIENYLELFVHKLEYQSDLEILLYMKGAVDW